MTTFHPADWHRANDAYLGDAIRWVRARLRHLAGVAGGRPTESDLALEIESSRQAMEAAGSQDDLAIGRLARAFRLSTFEQNCLLLCAAMELDTRVASLCAAAQGESSRCYPTFALALALFEDPTWDAISPHRPIRYWQLVHVARTPQIPLIASPLQADERIVNYLKGLNHVDTRLLPLLQAIPNDKATNQLAPSQFAVANGILGRLRQAMHSRAWSTEIIHLVGADPISKQLVASEVASTLGNPLFRLSTSLLEPAYEDFDLAVTLLAREARLANLAFLLQAGEHAKTRSGRLADLLRRIGGVLFLDSRQYEPNLSPLVAVEVEKPTPGEQQLAWHSMLPVLSKSEAASLAGQFRLNLPEIGRAVTQATNDVNEPTFQPVWNECRRLAQPRLDELAQRIDVKAGWDEAALPADVVQLLLGIADQVRHRARVLDDWGFRDKLNRGFGTTALFAGESGTGKTMAAEVIAGELNLDLYRVDLSTIVSKYIGETEKNLSRLFDASEDGGVVLFFDEADALFGRRSEVKDSHDRFANVQINHLLQRMESYRGLAILATNFKSALDAAFLRRLRFVVQFPFPEIAQRREIWERVFPVRTPVQPLDFDRLARLHLNGGNIHNIAMNAAFAAAAANSHVDMPGMLDAAKAEFLKMQKPLNLRDFQWAREEACT